MKVLLVNTSDHAGGAAIASLRLLKALRQANIEATLLCRDRSTQTEGMKEVIQLKPTLWRKAKFVLERFEIPNKWFQAQRALCCRHRTLWQ